MDGAHDTSLRIGEEDWRAVRRHYPKQQAGPVGHQRVGMRTLVIWDRFANDNCPWGMHLVHAGERRPGDDRAGGEAAVSFDRFRIVAASQPAVQPRNRSCRNPTGSAEKSAGYGGHCSGATAAVR